MRPLLILLALLPGAARADLFPLRVEAGPTVIDFTAEEIAGAQIDYAPGRDPVLSVMLAEDRTRDWAAFVAATAGQQAFVLVCGQSAGAPRPGAEPERVVLPKPPEADLPRLAALLTGRLPCDGAAP